MYLVYYCMFSLLSLHLFHFTCVSTNMDDSNYMDSFCDLTLPDHPTGTDSDPQHTPVTFSTFPWLVRTVYYNISLSILVESGDKVQLYYCSVVIWMLFMCAGPGEQ